MPKDSPCHHCTKRHPVCHSNCKEYKDWATEYATNRHRPQSEVECDIFLSGRGKRWKIMWDIKATERYMEGRGRR